MIEAAKRVLTLTIEARSTSIQQRSRTCIVKIRHPIWRILHMSDDIVRGNHRTHARSGIADVDFGSDGAHATRQYGFLMTRVTHQVITLTQANNFLFSVMQADSIGMCIRLADLTPRSIVAVTRQWTAVTDELSQTSHAIKTKYPDAIALQITVRVITQLNDLRRIGRHYLR